MNFKLNEDTSDIATIADRLREAEQTSKLPAPTRALLAEAAALLHDTHLMMDTAAEVLEKAAALRAGHMDSEGRHTEIARMKDAAMREQAQRLRMLLQRTTPGKRDEVI
jgi:hypothetical protein